MGLHIVPFLLHSYTYTPPSAPFPSAITKHHKSLSIGNSVATELQSKRTSFLVFDFSPVILKRHTKRG